MKKKFGSDDLPFLYTLPAKSLAPRISQATGIHGPGSGIEIGDWQYNSAILERIGNALAP